MVVLTASKQPGQSGAAHQGPRPTGHAHIAAPTLHTLPALQDLLTQWVPPSPPGPGCPSSMCDRLSPLGDGQEGMPICSQLPALLLTEARLGGATVPWPPLCPWECGGPFWNDCQLLPATVLPARCPQTAPTKASRDP